MRADVYTYPITRGNNVASKIRVDDIQASYNNVSRIGPKIIQDKITDLGQMKLFMFQDPDGNVIKFFSLDD